MLSLGNRRPASPLILLLHVCFVHWGAMTTPHQMQPGMMLAAAGALGKGTGGLSGTLLRDDHNEGSPPGQSIWLPPGDLGGVTPSRHSSPDSRADPRCSHRLGPWIALHLPRRQHVRAAFSARWLCHMLNSARKISILNLR